MATSHTALLEHHIHNDSDYFTGDLDAGVALTAGDYDLRTGRTVDGKHVVEVYDDTADPDGA
jgi:hypothetical protein